MPLICFDGKMVSVWDINNRCCTGIATFKDGACIIQDGDNHFHVVKLSEILLIKEEKR